MKPVCCSSRESGSARRLARRPVRRARGLTATTDLACGLPAALGRGGLEALDWARAPARGLARGSCCRPLRCWLRRRRRSNARRPDESYAGRATLEELWRAPGDDVAVVPGTSDYEPGRVRVSFLVVDRKGGRTLPTARVWVARGLEQKPFLETTADLERIGVPGGAEADDRRIYVAHVAVDRSRASTGSSRSPRAADGVQALGNVVVASEAIAAPGSASRRPLAIHRRSPAPAATPPRDDPRAARPRALEHSVAESLASASRSSSPSRRRSSARAAPAALSSTSSRTGASTRVRGPDVRFIHVEIYEDNDPAKGFNRWVRGVEAADGAVDVRRRRRRQDRRAFEGSCPSTSSNRRCAPRLAECAVPRVGELPSLQLK